MVGKPLFVQTLQLTLQAFQTSPTYLYRRNYNLLGCHYSLDWTTGLEYWTEVVSFFGLGFMILVYFQIFEETYNNQCI